MIVNQRESLFKFIEKSSHIFDLILIVYIHKSYGYNQTISF